MSRAIPTLAFVAAAALALVAAAALALLAPACADLELGCDDLDPMIDGPGGLTVLEEEHPTGWGRSRCLSCHSVERMHVLNCSDIEQIDLAEIRALVDEEGAASCAQCHGDNGVE